MKIDVYGGFALVLGGLISTGAWAQGMGTAEASLQSAEDGLFKGQVDHDAVAVASGMANELTYVHGNGRIQTKADFVQGIADGKVAYKSITTENRVIQVFGDAGVTRGESHKIVGDMQLTDLYLAVYVKRDGRWQLLDWQTSPLAPKKPLSAANPPAK